MPDEQPVFRPELAAATRERLAPAGHLYHVYDTGKIVNILLQLDGRTLRHVDPDELYRACATRAVGATP